MSNPIYREYEAKVADALARTGHPRSAEVLEDLREHLRETESAPGAPATLEGLIARLGDPSEYAESLAPATGYRPKSLFRRRIFWAAAAAFAAVWIASVAAFTQRHSLAARARELAGRNFYATPFFDLARMRALKPGAAADEIRDAIGYPLNRYSIVGRENEFIWEYTALPEREAPFYTMARLITDIDEMKLLRVEITERVEIGDHPDERIIQLPVSVDVGMLVYSRPGKEIRLAPSLPGIAVIIYGLGVESADDLSPERLERQRQFVTESWRNEIPREKIQFIHIAGRKGAATQSQLLALLESLPADSPVYNSMNEPGAFEIRGAPVGAPLYDVSIFCKGTLYQYPLIYVGDARREAAFRDDQNWLVRRLLIAAGQ